MNPKTSLKHSPANEQSIRDTNHFLWIETLVCDFLRWTLDAEKTFEPAVARKISYLFANVWKLQFSHPDALCSGAASLQLLTSLPTSHDYLLQLNERIEQELRVFFLSRHHDPLAIRLSQCEFVSQRRFLIDQMIALFETQSNLFTVPAKPVEQPANDVQPLPS
jgi:hypothetical protein